MMERGKMFNWHSATERGINTFIIIAALGVLLVLIVFYFLLKRLQKESLDIYKETAKEAGLEIENGGYYEETRRKLDYKKMDSAREKYNKLSSRYFAVIQLISIFPLLGLLGTIWGLIPGLQSASENMIEELSNNLSTALTSTLFGLIASIGLKFFSVFPTAITNMIEGNLEENDRQLDYVMGFRQIREKQE